MQLTSDLVLHLLTIEPEKRILVNDVPNHPWCMTWVLPRSCCRLFFNSLFPRRDSVDPRPSQLTREQLPEALTQGLRSTGMMAVADPTFRGPAAAAYAARYVR